jgi:hypothetical protein
VEVEDRLSLAEGVVVGVEQKLSWAEGVVVVEELSWTDVVEVGVKVQVTLSWAERVGVGVVVVGVEVGQTQQTAKRVVEEETRSWAEGVQVNQKCGKCYTQEKGTELQTH